MRFKFKDRFSSSQSHRTKSYSTFSHASGEQVAASAIDGAAMCAAPAAAVRIFPASPFVRHAAAGSRPQPRPSVPPNLSVLTRAKIFGGVLFHSKATRFFRGPALLPAATSHSGCDQPSAGCEIFNPASSFFCFVLLAQIAAQDGVYKTSLRAKTVRFGQFDVSLTAAWSGMRSSQKIW